MMNSTTGGAQVQAIDAIDTKSSEKGPSTALFKWWAVSNLAVGSIPLADDIYLSQITLIGLCAAIIALDRGPHAIKKIAGVGAVCLSLLIWVVLADGFENAHFVSETLKTFLLIASAVILWGSIGWRDLGALARIMPFVVTLVLTAVFVLDLGNYYGDEGRFGVPWWGSPNSTAFVVAIAASLQLYDIRRRWEALPNTVNRPIRCLPQFVQFLVLCAFVLFTGSSGGLLSLSVVVLRMAGLRLRVIFGGIAVAIIGVLIIGVELPELVGSGRPLIWQELIDDFYYGGWRVWAVGRGPGAIDLHPWFTESVQSAHSMYIEIGFGFGVSGLLLMIFALTRYARILANAPLDNIQRSFLEATFGALIMGFFVDTYLMTAQLTWFGALVIACGALATRRARE